MRILATIALLGCTPAAMAQVSSSAGELNDLIEMVRNVAQLERKAVMTDELQMTREESTRFWPIYDAYRAEVELINDRLVQLILEHAEAYENLPDSLARSMVDDFFDIEMDRLKVRSKYIRKFDDVLPPKKLARLVQVENKLDAVAQLALAEEIPLVQ